MFQQLAGLEREVDALLARKRTEVAAAQQHVLTVPKKLRVYLFAARSNQPTPTAGIGGGKAVSAPAAAPAMPGDHACCPCACRGTYTHPVHCPGNSRHIESSGVCASVYVSNWLFWRLFQAARRRQRRRMAGRRRGPSTCTGGCWSREGIRRPRGCRRRRSPSATTCGRSRYGWGPRAARRRRRWRGARRSTRSRPARPSKSGQDMMRVVSFRVLYRVPLVNMQSCSPCGLS